MFRVGWSQLLPDRFPLPPGEEPRGAIEGGGRVRPAGQQRDVLAFHARRGALCRAASERVRDLGRYWRAARAQPLTRFDRNTLRRVATAADSMPIFSPAA